MIKDNVNEGFQLEKQVKLNSKSKIGQIKKGVNNQPTLTSEH